jgi:magnesium chelatase family protein
VHVQPPGLSMAGASGGEPTAVVAARVGAARAAQGERWRQVLERRRGVNADVPGSVLRGRPWRLPASATTTLDRSLETSAVTLRGYDRTLRCAWTIADLMGLQRPGREEVDLALSLRHRAGVAA